MSLRRIQKVFSICTKKQEDFLMIEARTREKKLSLFLLSILKDRVKFLFPLFFYCFSDFKFPFFTRSLGQR